MKYKPGPKPRSAYPPFKQPAQPRTDAYANPGASLVQQKAANRPDESARRAGIKYIWGLERSDLTLPELELLVWREKPLMKLTEDYGIEMELEGLSDTAANAIVKEAAEDAQKKQKHKECTAKK